MSRKLPINDNLNEINVSNEIILIKGERTPTVEAWYMIAAENLLSAQILLENNRVNHAVFFIEQCVECIVKGLFLQAGILDATMVEKISHNPDDAFKQLYEKIGYEQGIEYCRQIPEMLNKRTTFENKLILCASLSDQFTTHFKQFQLDFQSNVISTDKSDYETLLKDYLTEEKFYYQNMLLLLSCLFNHDVESAARYFVQDNNTKTIIFPKQVFATPKIYEGLPSFISLLTIIKDYFGQDLTNKIK